MKTLQVGEYLVAFDRPGGGEPTVQFQHLAEALTIPGRVLVEMNPPTGQPVTIGRDGQNVSLTAEELQELRQAYGSWQRELFVLGAEDVALVTGSEIVLADGSVVPIIKDQWPDGRPFKWADERQWCKRVHQALDDGLSEAAGKQMKAVCSCWEAWPDGRRGCTLTSGPRSGTYAPCLFDEPRNSKGWAKARRWVSVNVDGESCLTLTQ